MPHSSRASPYDSPGERASLPAAAGDRGFRTVLPASASCWVQSQRPRSSFVLQENHAWTAAWTFYGCKRNSPAAEGLGMTMVAFRPLAWPHGARWAHS